MSHLMKENDNDAHRRRDAGLEKRSEWQKLFRPEELHSHADYLR